MYVVPLAAAAPFALVGVHMLRVALRSGAAPDRLLAAVFCLLALGVPPRLIGVDLATTSGLSAAFPWACAANWLIGGSIVCLAAFTWRTFRVGEWWATALTVILGASMAGVATAMTVAGRVGGGGALAVGLNALAMVALAWAFVECARYQAVMRRRLAMGLADPVVANRFLLWALWTGALAAEGFGMLALRFGLFVTGAGEILAAGGDPGAFWTTWIFLLKASMAIVGPLIVVCVWLSFSPPAAYRRWLEEGRASA